MAILGKYIQKKLESKVKFVQCIRSMNRKHFSQEYTFHWLSREDLKGQTGSEIIEAQDSALQNQISCDKIISNKNRQQMQNLKIIRGDTGTHNITETSTGKRKTLKTHDIVCDEIKKKTAILGTAHILREVLMKNSKTYFTSELAYHAAQTVHAEQPQHCIP